MKVALYVAIAVIVETPDDNADVSRPLARNPFDELAARLKQEMQSGRRYRPGFTMPGRPGEAPDDVEQCFTWN